jgi:hypothetical protein
MPPSGMLRYVALVRTNVWEELTDSIIRVTRIGELRTLALPSQMTAFFTQRYNSEEWCLLGCYAVWLL